MQTLDQNLADLVRRNVIAGARREGQVPRKLPGLINQATNEGNQMERDQASKFVNDLLRLMLARSGSDLFLTGWSFPPAIKVDGKISKVSPQPLTRQHTLQLARAVMNDKQAAEFEKTKNATSRSRRRASGASASMPSCSRATSGWCSAPSRSSCRPSSR